MSETPLIEVCNLAKTFWPGLEHNRLLRPLARLLPGGASLDEERGSGPVHAVRDVSFVLQPGQVLGYLGPNGSGKSTLAQLLAGREGYEITEGSVTYHDKNLLELPPEERVHEGFFLAFQYPVEIPGVNSSYFLRAAVNAIRTHHGKEELNAADFLKLMREKIQLLELDESLLKRSVNEGFSGGEKKRAEILQMALLEPAMAVLDETDSGLDIDALKVVANGVNHLKRKDNAQLIITHYQRLLNYIVPDHVHVLHDGRIVKSGGKKLALELEEKGYDWIIQEELQTA